MVSGALDRLHYERDPCVKYDSNRKVWIYLHRSRSEEEFGKISTEKKWNARNAQCSISRGAEGPQCSCVHTEDCLFLCQDFHQCCKVMSLILLSKVNTFQIRFFNFTIRGEVTSCIKRILYSLALFKVSPLGVK